MRDVAAYVRRHLPARDLPADRYAAIVDELAAELEARYTRHLENGATDEDAWRAAAAEIPDWVDLARDLATTTPAETARLREGRTIFTRRAGTLDRWTRDL